MNFNFELFQLQFLLMCIVKVYFYEHEGNCHYFCLFSWTDLIYYYIIIL